MIDAKSLGRRWLSLQSPHNDGISRFALGMQPLVSDDAVEAQEQELMRLVAQTWANKDFEADGFMVPARKWIERSVDGRAEVRMSARKPDWFVLKAVSLTEDSAGRQIPVMCYAHVSQAVRSDPAFWIKETSRLIREFCHESDVDFDEVLEGLCADTFRAVFRKIDRWSRLRQTLEQRAKLLAERAAGQTERHADGR